MNERKTIDLDQGWDFMQKGILKLKNILEGLPEPQFSSEDYMMLYTTIYNMCTQKPPHDYSQQLYDKYRESFEEYITTTVLPSLREKRDELMLTELVRRWSNHKDMVRWLSRFFHYLDRYFIARRSLPTLNEVGLACFRDLVYQEVNEKVRDAVISLIDQEREGKQIGRASLKNVLGIFVEIGMGQMEDYENDFEAAMLKDTASYYENDFEAAMLKDTASYYSRKASNSISEDSFPDYMLKAEKRDVVGLQEQFQHLKIELQAIESATTKFHDSFWIGQGGFGKVYEANNICSQSVVAVKRLISGSWQGDNEFWNEVIMLSSYKHNNIVSLLGFCDDCGEKILIYEYASRKSLKSHLNNKDLTWVQRLQICIGAARGLAYLHDPGQTQQIVLHCDIKSSNILLDEDWNARIGDFGLSKFGPANAETGLVTKKSDVYSFGVVLFEMLHGRSCSCSELLIDLVQKCYKQKATDDDIIFGDIKDEINPHSLKAFTTIVRQCLNKEQEQPPSMTMVVKELESALKLQVSNVPPPPSLSPAESSASPNESSLILQR